MDLPRYGGDALAGQPEPMLLRLDPGAAATVLPAIAGELGIPKAWVRLIERLTDDEPVGRPAADEVIDELQRTPRWRMPVATPMPTNVELAGTVRAIVRYTSLGADLGREDRVYPASSRVFATNALSISTAISTWAARTFATLRRRSPPASCCSGCAGRPASRSPI